MAKMGCASTTPLSDTECVDWPAIAVEETRESACAVILFIFAIFSRSHRLGWIQISFWPVADVISGAVWVAPIKNGISLTAQAPQLDNSLEIQEAALSAGPAPQRAVGCIMYGWRFCLTRLARLTIRHKYQKHMLLTIIQACSGSFIPISIGSSVGTCLVGAVLPCHNKEETLFAYELSDFQRRKFHLASLCYDKVEAEH